MIHGVSNFVSPPAELLMINDNIRLNQLVTHIKSTGTCVEVTTTDMGTFKQQVYRAKYVITTVPLFRLDDIQFSPPLSSDRKQAIQTQSGGTYFTAHVLADSKARHFWTRNNERWSFRCYL